ncbi:molybdopterin-dependent oxidoreductase [Clostridium bowmanii]|uniref:xanthine dehydrogenase family protein molybdopterin-binding subunit n=1 Tax=Clostridium bowmanii TaxID=132925 RepID=UPI001C0DC711|nr:molybdopterin cofactor-binding domain-containing protein [Clostridium bowmanii]MBU3188193.1 molybdopterin-dependent oxidoreductase [Clostridium bowmanii]MCA1072375.1 molybdopterin-dependent oxidoreductase [Clostridium bowmanii]
MNKDYRYIGKKVPMFDAYEKVTGKIRYVGDMVFPEMLYGSLLLSNIAHGIIVNIDICEAEKLPGVVKILTYENTPHNYFNSHKWFEGLSTVKDELMFNDKVRFVGDKIAAVFAEDYETARKACKLIKVKYEKLTPVISPFDALKEDSVKIHETSNLIIEKVIKCGDAENALNNANFIIEDTVVTPKIHHAAMEPHVCISTIDEFKNITIYSPCQEVFQVQLVTSKAIGIPKNKIRVIKTPMGGSFGGKTHPILEQICAFISLITGRSAKLLLDRTQSIIATRTRHNVVGNIKTAVSSSGEITGRDIDVVIDTGAYFTNAEAVCMAMGKKAFRLYRIYNQRFRGRVVYTNTPIGGPARGYGSPQIHAISEINMNNVARKLNMNPIDIYLKNLVHPYDKDPTGGTALGDSQILNCVIKGAEAFDFRKRFDRVKDKGRYKKGVGMACVTHGNGYKGAFPDFTSVSLSMDSDGSLVLKQSIHDLGCGTVTTMMQIAAEVLDMDIKNIRVFEADTMFTPYDSAGTQASRVTYVCGAAVKSGAEIIKQKLISFGSRLLISKEEDVYIDNGYICNNKGDRLSYGNLVIQVELKFNEDIATIYTYKSPANPGAYAADFAEVTVDTLTGMVRVTDFLAVHDIGQAINKTFVEGQIHGAVQMGIGYALTEDLNIDKDGNIKSDRFSKYHVINCPDMPDVKVILIENGEENGPFGAKSVGEISTNGVAPAVINAINNALDVNITTMPANQERVMSFIKDKR